MMTEAGLVQHWLNEEIGSVPQCLRPPTADRSDGIAALDLESFGGPLLVVAAGEEETPCKTTATRTLYNNFLEIHEIDQFTSRESYISITPLHWQVHYWRALPSPWSCWSVASQPGTSSNLRLVSPTLCPSRPAVNTKTGMPTTQPYRCLRSSMALRPGDSASTRETANFYFS